MYTCTEADMNGHICVYIYINTYIFTHTYITIYIHVSHCGLLVSKHGLYVGSLGSISTAVTTRTAAGGDTGHASLNHSLASPYQGVKLVPAKCWEHSYRCWSWVGCKQLVSSSQGDGSHQGYVSSLLGVKV